MAFNCNDNKENLPVYHARLTGVQLASDCELSDFTDFVMTIAEHVQAPEQHDTHHYLMQLRFETKEDEDNNNSGERISGSGSRVDIYHCTYDQLQAYCKEHDLGPLRYENERSGEGKLNILVDAKWPGSDVRKVVAYRFPRSLSADS